MNNILVTAELIADSITIEKEVLLNTHWNGENPEAYKIIKDLENFNTYENRILIRIDKAILDEDIRFLLEEYKKNSSKLLRFMNGDFRRLKSKLVSFYKNETPISKDTVISDLEELLECQKVRDEIRSNEINGKNLFGHYWNAEKTDTQFLIDFTQWIVSFRKLIIENKITDRALDIVSSGVNSQEIEKTVSDVTQNASEFIKSLNELNKYLYMEYNLENINFIDLDSILNFLRERMNEYAQIKEYIQSFYKLKPPMGDDILIKDLKELLVCKDIRTDIRNNELGKNLFGSYWDYEKSDTSVLIELSKWLTEFNKLLSKGKITEQALDIVSSGVNGQEIEKTISEISPIKEEIINTIVKLDNYLHFKEDIKEWSINNLKSQLNIYHSEINSLPNWSQFILGRNEVKKTIANNIIETINSDELKPDDILACFEGNFADSLLRKVFSDIPAISSFVGNLHEKKINSFKELDNKLIALNRLRVIRDLYNNRPPLYISASPRLELGILKSEFTRKRRHMPLRKLFLTVGNLIQKIKPCFMMSPLSIAQYLVSQVVSKI